MISHFFSRLRIGLVSLIRRPLHPHPAGSGHDGASGSGLAPPAVDTGRGSIDSLRSLEERKADLARLRASSKERHAAIAITREVSFDDAVFADFRAPSAPAPIAKGHDDYPTSVYVPRTSSKPSSTAPQERRVGRHVDNY